MKTANTTSGSGQIMSLSDHVARLIALKLVHLQCQMAKAADRIINHLPKAYQRRIFIVIGLIFSALLLFGIFSSPPIPAIHTAQVDSSHIGQASGLPGGEHPIIQPDTITTK